MKYVSCRKGFDSLTEFADTNLSYYGSPVPAPSELVMIHGYNCQSRNVQDAYRSNKEISREMGIENPMAGFLWPGLGTNWLESLEFHKAQRQADLSAPYLAKYLIASGEPPNVITHSLGARVALEAILHHGAKVKTLVLMGAAVKNDDLTTTYKAVQDSVGKVLVVWSENDGVLGRAFRLDQMRTALGHSGPTDKADWIQEMNVSKEVWDHSDYRHIRTIWTAIKASL